MDKVLEKKYPIKKITLLLVISIMATIVAMMVYGSSNGGVAANLEKNRIIVSTVKRSKFEEYIPLRATVESSKSVFVDAVEGGRVEKILLEEGSIVEEGDVILMLSNRRLQLDVIAREAQATEQLNNLHNTQLALKQNSLSLKEELIETEYRITGLTRELRASKPLLDSKAVSMSDYEKLEEDISYWKKRKLLTLERLRQDNTMRLSREKQLKSSIELLEHNLTVARSVLDSLAIRAPQQGKLTSLNAELGESKSPGENLGIIDKVDSFKASSSVSEFYINKINVGQKASLSVDGNQLEMTVNKILPEVENSQFQVEFGFDNSFSTNLTRGQTLSLKLQVSASENAVVLDNGPFYNDTGGAWLYILNETGDRAERRQVKLGRRTPSMVEVIEGLLPGDKVITSSYRSFLNADIVNIKES
jgi:HlyD family secretion protein